MMEDQDPQILNALREREATNGGYWGPPPQIFATILSTLIYYQTNYNNLVNPNSSLNLLFQMMEDQRPRCMEATGGGCWGPPPPIFDLPPPPKPPWMEHCNDQDFNTRPLTSSSIGGNTGIINDPMVIQDSCDINPLVIDSQFFMGENLFTILVIVICSLILVAIVLVVACVIYR